MKFNKEEHALYSFESHDFAEILQKFLIKEGHHKKTKTSKELLSDAIKRATRDIKRLQESKSLPKT